MAPLPPAPPLHTELFGFYGASHPDRALGKDVVKNAERPTRMVFGSDDQQAARSYGIEARASLQGFILGRERRKLAHRNRFGNLRWERVNVFFGNLRLAQVIHTRALGNVQEDVGSVPLPQQFDGERGTTITFPIEHDDGIRFAQIVNYQDPSGAQNEHDYRYRGAEQRELSHT